MSAKRITLAELDASKVYASEKSSVVKFQHPMEYLQPVLEIFQPYSDDLDIQGIVGSTNLEKVEMVDGVEMPQIENISYSRVIVKARYPSDQNLILPFITHFDTMLPEVGFVFALDTLQPELKAYTGRRVQICMNQCVFGADSVTSLNLLKSDSAQKIYDILADYASNVANERQRYLDRAEQMFNNKLRGSALYERIGKLLWEFKKDTKLGVTLGTEMIGLLQNPKTLYGLNEDDPTNDWTLYNACTEVIKKTNMLDEASKTKKLDKLFAYAN